MPRTLRNLNEISAIANDDWVHVNEVSDVLDQDKKITRFNLLGATLNGGGTINTGGFTLTVPATGTAALKTGAPVADRVAAWSDANTVKDAGYSTADVTRKTGAIVTNNITSWSDANTVKDSGVPANDVARLSQQVTFTSFVKATAFQTNLASISNGTVLTFPSGTGGNCMMLFYVQTRAQSSGLVHARTNPTAFCLGLGVGTEIVVTTGVLTGAAAASKLTVSAGSDGNFYVENQLGSTLTFRWTLFI